MAVLSQPLASSNKDTAPPTTSPAMFVDLPSDAVTITSVRCSDEDQACAEVLELSDDGIECAPSYCVNCTSRLSADFGGDDSPSCSRTCHACGHDSDQDHGLLHPTVTAAASHQHGLCWPHAHPCKPACSQRVALLFDERMELHEEGAGDAPPHPERPDRIRAVIARLLSSGTADLCERLPCREATLSELQAVHDPSLLRMVHYASCIAPSHGLDPRALFSSDMYLNEHTFHCARLAAGSAAEAAVHVARGDAAHGAAIIRPPGHHAESGMAMGFCFANNAAVAARAAQAAGAKRVLILDWDIHHGNGTQQIFEEDPSVLYMSIHRHDGGQFYPGTGAAHEVGTGPGRGFSVNLAWQGGGLGDHDYMAAMEHLVIPIARQFKPDLLLVSAGFDAAQGDPIGECHVTPAGFAHMTAALKQVAPCVILLEGGYNLGATAVSTDACLRVLLGEALPPLAPGQASLAAWQAIREAVAVQARFWSCLGPGLRSGYRSEGEGMSGEGSGCRPEVVLRWGAADGPGAGAGSWSDEEDEEEDAAQGECCSGLWRGLSGHSDAAEVGGELFCQQQHVRMDGEPGEGEAVDEEEECSARTADGGAGRMAEGMGADTQVKRPRKGPRRLLCSSRRRSKAVGAGVGAGRRCGRHVGVLVSLIHKRAMRTFWRRQAAQRTARV